MRIQSFVCSLTKNLSPSCISPTAGAVTRGACRMLCPPEALPFDRTTHQHSPASGGPAACAAGAGAGTACPGSGTPALAAACRAHCPSPLSPTAHNRPPSSSTSVWRSPRETCTATLPALARNFRAPSNGASVRGVVIAASSGSSELEPHECPAPETFGPSSPAAEAVPNTSNMPSAVTTADLPAAAAMAITGGISLSVPGPTRVSYLVTSVAS